MTKGTMTLEELVSGFKELPTGFVTDALRRLGLSGWTDGVRPLSRAHRHIVGPAVTLKFGPARGDGPKMPSQYAVIRASNPGDVLVVAGGGTSSWLLGELICSEAMYHGMAGVVVDGCVRDGDEIAEMEMPVFALGSGVRPYSPQLEVVEVGGQVDFAGATVRPGDILVGDGDGLVVVPRERAEDVLFQARDIAEIEQRQHEAVKRRAPLEILQKLTASKKVPKQH